MEISIKNPSWLYRSKWGKKMELYSFDIFSQKQTMPLNWQGKITTELDFLILYFVFFFSCEHLYCPIKLHLKFFYLQWDLNMIIIWTTSGKLNYWHAMKTGRSDAIKLKWMKMVMKYVTTANLKFPFIIPEFLLPDLFQQRIKCVKCMDK